MFRVNKFKKAHHFETEVHVEFNPLSIGQLLEIVKTPNAPAGVTSLAWDEITRRVDRKPFVVTGGEHR